MWTLILVVAKEPSTPSNCEDTSQSYANRVLTGRRERMFAKPFLAQLGNGHVQGVYSMCKVGALPY
jgi:hypothetical protein